MLNSIQYCSWSQETICVCQTILIVRITGWFVDWLHCKHVFQEIVCTMLCLNHHQCSYVSLSIHWQEMCGKWASLDGDLWNHDICWFTFYASAFRHRRHYVFGLSVRPKPELSSFDLYMGTLVHPTNRNRFTAYPSVRPERFPGICQRTHGGNGLKFYMLMYLDHLQESLVYGHSLFIFLILALFWLSETGQIWGFRAFTGECMEEMAWNFARWCILTTCRIV